jgi:hypothetical protein
MADRNLEKELNYHYYDDMETGQMEESIDYSTLIVLLGEILDRLEKLEKSTRNEITIKY